MADGAGSCAASGEAGDGAGQGVEGVLALQTEPLAWFKEEVSGSGIPIGANGEGPIAVF